MSRDPRRVECTICTAVAPDAVFTVRTYAKGGSLQAGLVSKSRRPDQQNPRSHACCAATPQIVSQVRLQELRADWQREAWPLVWTRDGLEFSRGAGAQVLARRPTRSGGRTV
jgi:hypothetical protein